VYNKGDKVRALKNYYSDVFNIQVLTSGKIYTIGGQFHLGDGMYNNHIGICDCDTPSATYGTDNGFDLSIDRWKFELVSSVEGVLTIDKLTKAVSKLDKKCTCDLYGPTGIFAVGCQCGGT